MAPQYQNDAFREDSPSEWALWRLSLVLREISENSELCSEKREPRREVPAEATLATDDGEMNNENDANLSHL